MNTCVMCGEVIPEGLMVCNKHELDSEIEELTKGELTQAVRRLIGRAITLELSVESMSNQCMKLMNLVGIK